MIFRLKSPFLAFSAFLRGIAWKALGYRILTTDPEYMQRITTCYSCRHFVRASEQCGLCGCFAHAKALLTSEACPKKFWLRIREKHVTVID